MIHGLFGIGCRFSGMVMPAALFAAMVLFLVSCAEKGEPYPDIITEMADIHSDHNGRLCDFVTDKGKCYTITNTNLRPHRPDTVYRAVVGFVPETAYNSTVSEATVYSLAAAKVLSDSTAIVRHDPTGIESMWVSGRYINMQLTAKTQGGLHFWGYAIDNQDVADNVSRLYSHHYLSLHHVQGRDPLSYSATVYCSISVPSIPLYQTGDTVSVTVHTFNGAKSWTFPPQ